jgi:hypothetical protein
MDEIGCTVALWKPGKKIICTQSLPVVKIYAVTFTGGQVWTKLRTKCFWQDGLVAMQVLRLVRENADLSQKGNVLKDPGYCDLGKSIGPYVTIESYSVTYISKLYYQK